MTDATPSKPCTKCGETKSLGEFGPLAASKDGLQARCRPCVNSRRRELRRMTPAERVIAVTPTPWAGLSKCCTKCLKGKPIDAFSPTKDGSRGGRMAQCRECVRAYHAARYQSQRERMLATSKVWYAANRESVAVTRAAWWQRNADSAVEVRRERNGRRRARLLGATVGKIDLDALPLGSCSICDLPIDVDLRWPHPLSKSVDHVIPLAAGGAHAQKNLAWAHLRCNISKGVKLAAEATS